MTRLITCVAGGVLALCLAGTAWAATPVDGAYQGVVNGTITSGGHNEGEGYFNLMGSGTSIVPHSPFAKILAPSDFVCNQLNANLEAATIPVTGGAFNYKGKANIGTGAARMNVRFTGHWTAAKKLAGTTRIWNNVCDSGKIHWKMKSPPPPGSP
jgi:hypothetical protein